MPLPISFSLAITIASDCLAPANGLADEVVLCATVREGVNVGSTEVAWVVPAKDVES